MINVGKIAENGETVYQSVVWSRCSANQEIRKSYQKASLELLFLQIWKSRKLEKPYHKASLRLQSLCFQEFNKTQTVKLQCLGISSTLLQKSRMATFIHSFNSCNCNGPSWMETYYIQSHHCHQYILESHYNDQKIVCIVHCCTGMLHFHRKLYKSK